MNALFLGKVLSIILGILSFVHILDFYLGLVLHLEELFLTNVYAILLHFHNQLFNDAVLFHHSFVSTDVPPHHPHFLELMVSDGFYCWQLSYCTPIALTNHDCTASPSPCPTTTAQHPRRPNQPPLHPHRAAHPPLHCSVEFFVCKGGHDARSPSVHSTARGRVHG